MHFYRNGNYVVCIMDDGTKIRKTNENEFIPSFSEGIDVAITYKCNIGCKQCYMGCTNNGNHGDLLGYKFLETLHPYTELAFNGNDMDHPQLIQFLNKLKEKKVYANMTVNQKQFLNNYDLIKKLSEEKLIYGLGVSYSFYDTDFINKVKEFPNAVIHVINGIIGLSDLNSIKSNNLKMLILGYKDVGRGVAYHKEQNEAISRNQESLKSELKKIIDNKWFDVVSFDNLGIEQLEVKKLMDEDKWKEFYMGDDGNFTFYIDMVSGKFSKNSCVRKTYDIGEKSIDEMFDIIRKEEINNN